MNLGVIYALLAAITWGAVYTLDQKLLTTLSPFNLIFLSSLITLVISLPVVLITHDLPKVILHQNWINLLLLFISIVLGILAGFFILSSIKTLDASTASIIEILYPFFVVFFSFFIFRTIPSPLFFLGSILIFLGLFVIIRYCTL